MGSHENNDEAVMKKVNAMNLNEWKPRYLHWSGIGEGNWHTLNSSAVPGTNACLLRGPFGFISLGGYTIHRDIKRPGELILVTSQRRKNDGHFHRISGSCLSWMFLPNSHDASDTLGALRLIVRFCDAIRWETRSYIYSCRLVQLMCPLVTARVDYTPLENSKVR